MFREEFRHNTECRIRVGQPHRQELSARTGESPDPPATLISVLVLRDCMGEEYLSSPDWASELLQAMGDSALAASMRFRNHDPGISYRRRTGWPRGPRRRTFRLAFVQPQGRRLGAQIQRAHRRSARAAVEP